MQDIVKGNMATDLPPSIIATSSRPTIIAAVLRPSIVVAVVYGVFLSIVSLTQGYSALDYVHLGTIWTAHLRGGTWGYDGQFYYQLARDPLGAQAFMDNAPYRYQHILYPLVVHLLSFGQVALIPYVLLLVNWLSIVLSVEIISRLLVKHGLSPWFSLAPGLYFGQTAAFAFDTAEPFTYLLVCIGLWLLEEDFLTWAALFMGLATLSRETAVLFPIGYALFFLIRKRWQDVARFIILGILPLVVWLVLLRIIFGKTGITFTPPFEQTPFAGIFLYSQAPRKFWLLLLLMFIPTSGSWLLAGRQLLRRQLGPMLLIWLANLALITFLSHHSYGELISCGRIGIGLVLAGLLYGIKNQNRLILWASQFYTFTFLVYLLGILLHVASFMA